MVNKTYPIRGISTGIQGERVPVRREFGEWVESKDENDRRQVCLFFLALDNFQKVDPASRDSYFQIAGIHGFPYEAWDEDNLTQSETQGPEGTRRGYCMHANALFPVWHRPYMLLYEQRIHEIMINIIVPQRLASTRAKWLKAAETWRLPFWDWGVKPMSHILSAPNVYLSIDGTKIDLPNPMYQFRMPLNKNMGQYGVGNIPNADTGKELQYRECYATSRGVKEPLTDQQWKEGFVDDDYARSLLAGHQSITDFDYGAASELVYRLLTYPIDWPHFATLSRDISKTSATASTTSVMNDVNIEFIHNNIHFWVGGNGGHMSQIPVATFDPSFWLHHCNIDRLFAIWQTLNQDIGRNSTTPGGPKDKWFDVDQQRYFDQKITGGGDVVTSKTPLRPFKKDENGTMWTPMDAINWYNLGYTYPDLQPWNSSDFASYKEQLFANVNQTYGQVRSEALAHAKRTDLNSDDSIEISGDSVKINDYAISLSFKKFAFDGEPFNVEIYLRPKDAPKDRKSFAIEEYVTNVYNFSQPAERHGEEVCSNCASRKAEDVMVQSYIPLTSYLLKVVEEGRLKDLSPVNVEEFLQGLYYRVTRNGIVVDEAKWSGKPEFGLKTQVSQMKMTFSEDPKVQPERTEPQIMPTLGVGLDDGGQSSGNALTNLVTANTITPLTEPISDGSSIVFTCPTSKAAKTSRESRDTLSLLSYPEGSTKDISDEDSYDCILSIFLRSKAQTLEFDSREAGKLYGTAKTLDSPAWIPDGGPNSKIRVDLKADKFDIWIGSKKVGSFDRKIKGKKVTHVRNWHMAGKQPILGKEITATTYKSTADVKN